MVDLSQKKVFLDSEGDKYFQRNISKYESEKDSVPLQIKFIEKSLKKGSKILEIGCSSGKYLDYFFKSKGCECYGIDPSQEAINYGKNQYPALNLSVGTSDSLQFPDEYFDFVLFGFCLYLVDRRFLSKSITEADRVLKNKGFISIIDFDSKLPRKRSYKHYNGVFSFKMDYSQLFLAYPHYSRADKLCFSHTTTTFVDDVGERVSAVILFKDYDNAYILDEER